MRPKTKRPPGRRKSTPVAEFPLVAIVGRPNVGKSSLLNAFARKRVSIVHAEPGVTRDRVSVAVRHGDRRFEVVDTGGIGFSDDDGDDLSRETERQIDFAIAAADVVLFVVDVRDGLV